jgi:glutamine---fructose-6-phosphate transaminase (isomerizing)
MNLGAAQPDGPDEMGRELAEGPDAVARSIASVTALRTDIDRLLTGATRIVLVGTGASLAVARVAAPAWRRRSPDRPIVVRQSTEAVLSEADGHRFERADLVLAISQSGTSPETIAALRLARSSGCQVIAVTAHASSPLAAEASLTVPVGSGEERGAATKSALATLATLYAMAGALDGGAGDGVTTAVHRIVGSWAEVIEGGQALVAARQTWFLGFGSALGIAESGALLWYEKVARPAMATTPSEFRHGPIEAVGREDAVVLIDVDGTDQRRLAYVARLVEELDLLGVEPIDIRPAEPPPTAALAALVRVQQLARATALAAGTYRDEFRVLRRVVRPATDLFA